MVGVILTSNGGNKQILVEIRQVRPQGLPAASWSWVRPLVIRYTCIKKKLIIPEKIRQLTFGAIGAALWSWVRSWVRSPLGPLGT